MELSLSARLQLPKVIMGKEIEQAMVFKDEIPDLLRREAKQMNKTSCKEVSFFMVLFVRLQEQTWN